MRAQDIVNRLSQILPKYTSLFSDELDVSTLTASAGTATCTTTTDHGLATGRRVTISNIKQKITISSIVRTGQTVSVTTIEEHGLIDPSKYSPPYREGLRVNITGTDSAEYSGEFQLLTVLDRNNFTYKIDTTPATPATTAGFFLQDDYNTYNGFKEITVTASNQFTYDVPTTLPVLDTDALDGTTRKVSFAGRVGWAATAERAAKYYDSDASRILQNWMFVVLGTKATFKDSTTASDISVSTNINESFYYETQQDFSVIVFLPCKNELLAGFTSDIAYELEKPILKSLANYKFPSNLTEGETQPTVYVGNETEDYTRAFYVHRFDFIVKGKLFFNDAYDPDPGVLLTSASGTIVSDDVEFNVTLDE